MDKPLQHYWQIRLNSVKEALEANHFEAFVVDSALAAKDLVLQDILPKMGAKKLSWGGSMTFRATGLYDALVKDSQYQVLDTYDSKLSREEVIERRRQALMTDLFITGTNAVTEDGMLVNLDMIGNRVAAITFGPQFVVILVGRNKIVPDLEEAISRVKNIAAPANAIRLDKKTPCVKTSYCEDCKTPERICNVWTITEKAYPKGRIKVVLINEDLGL
ncbi:MAG: lactate utilization protein [Desulfobacteraceae bacterium]|nr:MAG: lactate utilization protein [Desulfobacteraceae bacterium]